MAGLTYSEQQKHALMIEAAPLAAEFLSTGKGLDNPELVAAMIAVGQEDQNNNLQELALRILEEANANLGN